ncbi:MAG: AsmA-like C-terminal region-containing protein, partial [Chromatiales bacterium]|nr:AsmA-like C-terminal region-containing protein [Chromatiales bacterium]
KVEDLSLVGGRIDANAVVDASGNVPRVNYQASVKGAQARPLLVAFAGTDTLSGTANIEAEGTTQGVSQRAMVTALNGKGSFNFLDGAIHGMNIAAALRQAQTLGMSTDAKAEQKTDFAEFSGTYVIKDGIVDNRDLKLLAPLLRIGGAGLAPMPPRTLEYALQAKLVGTLEGQGGKDALSGVPISVNVTGPWHAPKFGVDWASVFQVLASDPTRLANLPGGLSSKAKELGIALPGLGGKAGDLLKGVTGGGGAGAVLKGLTGGATGGGEGAAPASPIGAAAGLLKGLTGAAPTTPQTGDEAAAKPAPAPAPAAPVKQATDLLKGLFK